MNFLVPQLHAKMTEEVLETIFAPFGSVADIVVKRHLCSYDPVQVTGYAFVYFTDIHAALRAIYALKSGPINGVFLEGCLSYKAEQMLKNYQGMDAVIQRQQTPNTGAFFKRFSNHSRSTSKQLSVPTHYQQHNPHSKPNYPSRFSTVTREPEFSPVQRAPPCASNFVRNPFDLNSAPAQQQNFTNRGVSMSDMNHINSWPSSSCRNPDVVPRDFDVFGGRPTSGATSVDGDSSSSASLDDEFGFTPNFSLFSNDSKLSSPNHNLHQFSRSRDADGFGYERSFHLNMFA